MERCHTLFTHNLRIDGRALFEFREIAFQRRAPGSVELHIGDSKALGECLVVPAPPRRIDAGIFRLNVNFLPLANPAFVDAKGPRDLVEIGKLVERVRVVNVKSCVVYTLDGPGQ